MRNVGPNNREAPNGAVDESPNHIHRLFTWAGWQGFAAIVVSLTAVGASIFSGVSLMATRQSNETARDLAITDRFQKATELLNSDTINSRVTALFVLGEIMQDSPGHELIVVKAITAFLSEQSRMMREKVRAESNYPRCPAPGQDRLEVADFSAALEVLDRRPLSADGRPQVLADLRNLCLSNVRVDASSGGLRGARFDRSDLHQAYFGAHSRLEGAKFWATGMQYAAFLGVRLNGADFRGASLQQAQFSSDPIYWDDEPMNVPVPTDLTDANFSLSDLSGAAFDGGVVGLRLPEDFPVFYNASTAWPPGFLPACPSGQFRPRGSQSCE